MEEIVSIGRFSRETGIPIYTLRRMCHRGCIVPYDRITSRLRFRFLLSQKNDTVSSFEKMHEAKRRHVFVGTGKSIRKYALDERFFEKLNPESAYVLGYIWTDGCLKQFNRGSWGILFECLSKDRSILEDVKKAMKTEAPIRMRKRVFPSGTQIELSKLCIYSNAMVGDVVKYGVIPMKSKKNPLPINIPDDLVFHFIRGVFDGDGSLGRESKRQHRLRLSFSGKSNLLRWIDERFVSKLGTKPRNLYRSTPTKLTRSECWQTVYSRREDIQKIASALYNEASLFLMRKKVPESFQQQAA